MLNIKSFSGGNMTAIQITSWTGTSLTSARQVFIPELVLGNQKLSNLRLPAIDLSPIAEACGGRIDGILGVDLLEEFGATLDLKNRVALMGEETEGSEEVRQLELQENHESCLQAFNRADRNSLAQCLDAQVALFTASNEVRGKQEVIEYLQQRYFDLDPPARLEIQVRDLRFLGEVVWFGYDLKINLPDEVMVAQGMAICRRADGSWRLLNMHNSFEEKR
jgi:hypothetical protein